MKQSKGYVHKVAKNLSHPTERYDHVVDMAYRGKDFSRMSKSMMHAKPNDLGDTLIEDHKRREEYSEA